MENLLAQAIFILSHKFVYGFDPFFECMNSVLVIVPTVCDIYNPNPIVVSNGRKYLSTIDVVQMKKVKL